MAAVFVELFPIRVLNAVPSNVYTSIDLNAYALLIRPHPKGPFCVIYVGPLHIEAPSTVAECVENSTAFIVQHELIRIMIIILII